MTASQISKKLTVSNLYGFCAEANSCKNKCGNKKPVKVLTRNAQAFCLYTFEYKNLIFFEQPQQLQLTLKY